MGLIKIIRELSYLKRSNIVYEHEYTGTLFVERVFAFEVPRLKEHVSYKGQYYVVVSIWHEEDDNGKKFIEVTLKDL